MIVGFTGSNCQSQMIISYYFSVHHLSLHFPTNFGEDVTEIYYIGLKGEFTPGHRTGVVNAVYEARPMLEDHKQDLKEHNFSQGPGF